MSSTRTRPIEWRFSDPEEVEAWLRHPDQLHMQVAFQSPEGGQWYTITTVTRAWLRKHAEEPFQGAIWPALLIVPDAERDAIERSIATQLESGWKLIIHNAKPF